MKPLLGIGPLLAIPRIVNGFFLNQKYEKTL